MDDVLCCWQALPCVFNKNKNLRKKETENIYIEKKMEAKKATLSCFFIRFVVVAVKAAFNSTLIILWLSVVDHFLFCCFCCCCN